MTDILLDHLPLDTRINSIKVSAIMKACFGAKAKGANHAATTLVLKYANKWLDKTVKELLNDGFVTVQKVLDFVGERVREKYVVINNDLYECSNENSKNKTPSEGEGYTDANKESLGSCVTMEDVLGMLAKLPNLTLQELEEKYPIGGSNETSDDYRTQLSVAVHSTRHEELLLCRIMANTPYHVEHGIPLGEVFKHFVTALNYAKGTELGLALASAAANMCTHECAALMSTPGIEFNVMTHNGFSPLYYAVFCMEIHMFHPQRIIQSMCDMYMRDMAAVVENISITEAQPTIFLLHDGAGIILYESKKIQRGTDEILTYQFRDLSESLSAWYSFISDTRMDIVDGMYYLKQFDSAPFEKLGLGPSDSIVLCNEGRKTLLELVMLRYMAVYQQTLSHYPWKECVEQYNRDAMQFAIGVPRHLLILRTMERRYECILKALMLGGKLYGDIWKEFVLQSYIMYKCIANDYREKYKNVFSDDQCIMESFFSDILRETFEVSVAEQNEHIKLATIVWKRLPVFVKLGWEVQPRGSILDVVYEKDGEVHILQLTQTFAKKYKKFSRKKAREKAKYFLDYSAYGKKGKIVNSGTKRFNVRSQEKKSQMKKERKKTKKKKTYGSKLRRHYSAQPEREPETATIVPVYKSLTREQIQLRELTKEWEERKIVAARLSKQIRVTSPKKKKRK